MRLLLPLLLLCLLPACKTPGKIVTDRGSTLTPPGNASTPSSLKEGKRVETSEIPAGTTVVREIFAATKDSPAIERETTTYINPATNTVVEDKVEAVVSNERAPDQTVALHKVDVESRKPLLYAAMGLTLLTGVLAYARMNDWAVASGSVAAAFYAIWYATWLIIPAISLVAAGVAWSMYSQHKQKKKTEEALRRTIQSGQELAVDQPEMAKEFFEYQSSNLDLDHKKLIKAIAATTDKSYIVEQAGSSKSS